MDKLKLLMGRPLELSKEGDVFVYQPKMHEVIDMGEDRYNEYILPYVMTTDAVFNGMDNEDELISKYHLFDLFFIKVEGGKTVLDNIFGKNSLESLIESLSYFLKTDNIKVLEIRQKLVVNDSYLIDKDEFDKIRKVIQEVVCRNDIEIEKPPKNMSPRKRDIWEKIQKGRRRKAEKEAIYLQDMINFTSHGGKNFIPLHEIDNMYYFQFQNTYKAVMGIDSYLIGMGYKLSQKFDVKDDIKHWSETLKIGK